MRWESKSASRRHLFIKLLTAHSMSQILVMACLSRPHTPTSTANMENLYCFFSYRLIQMFRGRKSSTRDRRRFDSSFSLIFGVSNMHMYTNKRGALPILAAVSRRPSIAYSRQATHVGVTRSVLPFGLICTAAPASPAAPAAAAAAGNL